MKRETNIQLDLKYENRNRVFNHILASESISSSALSYDLQLSRPTIKQNLTELLEQGLIYESGSIGYTGGRRARTYSVVKKSWVSIGVDITRNHITVIMVDLTGTLIYEKRVRRPFSLDDAYMRYLGNLVEEAAADQNVDEEVLGVGIAVPALITEDHKKIFYGEILSFTGETVDTFAKYIPYPCRLYNDADAAGYAEISYRKDLSDAFYISLSNNVGGSILIDHKVYKGEGPRSGEVGHMTIIPDGGSCYCGQKGCFEVYGNASLLADLFDGDLAMFFKELDNHNPVCTEAWQDYIKNLSIAVNNVRMLFDCKVILGGYVGAYLEKYLAEIKELAKERNTFENNADYLLVCKVKKEALALGAALPFVHEFWKSV